MLSSFFIGSIQKEIKKNIKLHGSNLLKYILHFQLYFQLYFLSHLLKRGEKDSFCYARVLACTRDTRDIHQVTSRPVTKSRRNVMKTEAKSNAFLITSYLSRRSENDMARLIKETTCLLLNVTATFSNPYVLENPI